MTQAGKERIAAAIRQSLFKSGNGEQAVRIALIDMNGRDLGGWNANAAEREIVRVLSRELQEPSK